MNRRAWTLALLLAVLLAGCGAPPRQGDLEAPAAATPEPAAETPAK